MHSAITKRLLAIAGFVLLTAPLDAAEWAQEYDRLLQQYVSDSGVRYQDWHQNAADRRQLTRVVNSIAQESVEDLSKSAKLAFYLNAYNAWILHQILESYPTKGPGGGGFIGRTRFFRARSIRVAGMRTSFHSFENDVIRAQFDEPRIHFALNCASKSCPPLFNRAFTDKNLDLSLNHLTTKFINDNPHAIRAAKPGLIEISEIFKWYADDFGGKDAVRNYLNQYRRIPIPASTRIRYQDYQWSLNEAH